MNMQTDETPIRAFFAIDLPDSSKMIIHHNIEMLQKFYPTNAVRWIKPQSLHITLQFLKQIYRHDLDSLIEIAAPVIRRLPRIELALGPVQFFPGTTRPKIIALNTEPQHALMKISKAIGDCMSAINFPAEKRLFRGHVTLGRFNFNTAKDPVNLPDTALPSIPTTSPHEIILFRSQPKPAESHYMALHHFPLAD
jgi:2'-5' RNA ligase